MNGVATGMTWEDVGLVAAFPGLVSLNLSGFNEFHDDDFAALLGQLPELESLDIRWNSYLTDESAKSIGRAKKIQHLEVSGWNGLTDTGVLHLCDLEKRLLTFKASHCGQLTERAVRFISERCPNLEVFVMDHLPRDNDAAAESLSRLQMLTKVVASSWTKLTDVGCEYISKLHRLKSLTLDGSITTDGALKIAIGLENLEVIEISFEKLEYGDPRATPEDLRFPHVLRKHMGFKLRGCECARHLRRFVETGVSPDVGRRPGSATLDFYSV